MTQEIQNALLAHSAKIEEVQKMCRIGEKDVGEGKIAKVKELCFAIEAELYSEYIVAPAWDYLGFPHMIFEKWDSYDYSELSDRRKDLSIMKNLDDIEGLIYVDIAEFNAAL